MGNLSAILPAILLVTASVGMLGQAPGCDVNAIINIAASQLAGTTGEGRDDGTNHDVGDDRGSDPAGHDAGDDHGVDGQGHDSNDDHGVDGSGHDVGDDHGNDGAGHDAGDDRGGSPGNDDSNTNGSNNTAELSVKIRGGGVEVKVDYRAEAARRRLSVEVENAMPGSMHVILIAGVNVGTLTADDLGRAEVEFDTDVEVGHIAWPTGLATDLIANTSVQVGNLSGTLQPKR